MRIDLHVHGALSKQTGFDLELLREKMTVARERGLDAILLTEHFNIPGFATIYETLLDIFPFNGDYFSIENVRVFPGIEVNISEGSHLVAGGTLENILRLYDSLSNYRQKGQFCSAEIYFDKQAGMELLNVFAHPTRVPHQLHQLPERYYSNFDAFELNARDIYLYGRNIIRDMRTFSDKAGLPLVAGSDTHHPFQFGALFNEFHSKPESVSEIKKIIADGTYTLEVDDGAEEKVAAAIAAKKSMKAELLKGPSA